MRVLALVLSIAIAMPALAQHASPYAGEHQREIVSLSEADMQELRRGGGWGLARAAELNGVPGPTHLIELKDKIGLSEAQLDLLIDIRDRMRADAISAGTQLIAAERTLDEAFKSGAPDAATLAHLVSEAGAARTTLRLIHLSAHLGTPTLLTADQIAKYNTLRGYADDPCAAVPTGHDATQWRKHNGCE